MLEAIVSLIRYAVTSNTTLDQVTRKNLDIAIAALSTAISESEQVDVSTVTTVTPK